MASKGGTPAATPKDAQKARPGETTQGPAAKAKDRTGEYVAAALLGIAVVAMVGGLWYWFFYRATTEKGKRLWGVNLSSTTGTPQPDASSCAKACRGVPNATGYAEWVNGGACYCVGEPYGTPMYSDDAQWTSGLLKRNPFLKQ
jgi:hypothetical protein